MRPPVLDRSRAAGGRDPVIEWLRSGQPRVERRAPASDDAPYPAVPTGSEVPTGPEVLPVRGPLPAPSVADPPGGGALAPAATALRCAGCGEPIEEDQTVLRVNAGVARGDVFSHLLMRPDAYLHAGEADASGLPGAERWCVTEQGLTRAIALLRLHGLTGASTR